MSDPEMGHSPRGNPSPRDECPTFTTRAIALTMHCLRRASWVRRLAGAAQWLRYGEDAEAELLRRLPGWERRLLPVLRLPPLRTLYLGLVELRVPGTVRHLLCRKLWFWEQATAFLTSDESSQVVILGAGLDPLGVRLCRCFGDAAVFELDRAAPMETKRDAFGDLPNLRCITAGDTLGELTASGWDRDRRTLVLAEGVLMYLEPPDVERTFARWAAVRAPIRFAFSYLSVGELADPSSPVARLARALDRGRAPERFTWSVAPESLAAFLASSGYALEETMSAGQLASRLLGKGRAPREYGEFVAVATKQD